MADDLNFTIRLMNMTRTVAACFRAHRQAAKPSQGEERAYDKDGFAARVHLGSKSGRVLLHCLLDRGCGSPDQSVNERRLRQIMSRDQ
jgi:hypothetical protein